MTKPPPVVHSVQRLPLTALLCCAWLAGWTTPAQAAQRPAPPAVVTLANQLEKTAEGRAYRDACLPVISRKLRSAPPECGPTRQGKFVVDFVLIVNARGVVADLLVNGDDYTYCVVKGFKGLTLPKPPRGDWPVHITVEMKPHVEPGMPKTQKERQGTFAEADRLSRTQEGHDYEVACGPILFKALDRASKECAKVAKQRMTVDLALLVAVDGHVTGVLGATDAVTARAADSFNQLVLPRPPRKGWSLHVRLDVTPR